MKLIKNTILVLITSLSTLLTAQETGFSKLLQNIDSREKTSLNGMWDMIVDPLENGYYNHRLLPKDNGYFKNAKMQTPSELIEYDFDTSLQLMVPGDWNTQMDK